LPRGSLTDTNHATILTGSLTDLDYVAVTLDGTGTLAIDQLASLTDGSLKIAGGSYTFPSPLHIQDQPRRRAVDHRRGRFGERPVHAL
jgi:hypothetical protein